MVAGVVAGIAGTFGAILDRVFRGV